ncbi:hypothetical protein JCM10212_003161 [Sporobolomyces blumeae]
MPLYRHDCICATSRGYDDSGELSCFTKCGHVYHSSCLREFWRAKPNNHNTCLLCYRPSPVVRLFNLAHVSDALDGNASSSDPMTQETQAVLDEIERKRASRNKGKGRMVIPDDEEDDNGPTIDDVKEEQEDSANGGDGEGQEDELVRLRRQWREAMSLARDQRAEVERSRAQVVDLERQLAANETLLDEHRRALDAANAELASGDVDTAENLQLDKQALEEELKQVQEDLDRVRNKRDKALYARDQLRERVRQLEAELASDGSEERDRIAQLEQDKVNLEKLVSTVRSEKDRIELEMVEIKADRDRKIERAKAEAERKIQRAYSERVAAQADARQAQADADGHQKQVAALKAGNKQYQVQVGAVFSRVICFLLGMSDSEAWRQVKRLREKVAKLSNMKGRIEDSDGEGGPLEDDPTKEDRALSPTIDRRSKGKGVARQPLGPSTSHNLDDLFDSSPPALGPNIRIRNHASILSPVKDPYSLFDEAATAKAAGLGRREEEAEEDDLYEPRRPANEEVAAGDGGDDDDDIEVLSAEPAPFPTLTSNATQPRTRPLEFSNSHPSLDRCTSLPVGTTSRFFASTSSAPGPRHGPVLSSSAAVPGGLSKKRPFERHNSDKHLPVYGKSDTLDLGPKHKVKRR